MSVLLRAASAGVLLVALTACATRPDGATPQPPGPGSAHPSAAVSAASSARPSATSVTPSPGHISATPTPSASKTYPPELHGLAPLLADRFLAAQAGAAKAGLTLTLTSGYRSWEDQQAIFNAKVAEVGSVAEAKKWVLPPEKSEHVKGMAIDVGPTQTEMSWLERHQSDYGLCRMYLNEPWHFELAKRDGTCDPMKPSALEA